jgi:hypothetical protein
MYEVLCDRFYREGNLVVAIAAGQPGPVMAVERSSPPIAKEAGPGNRKGGQGLV